MTWIFLSAYSKLFAVPKALGSPKPDGVGSSAGTTLTIGSFSLKAEYVPFGQGSETLRRQFKKLALLDVPSDENM